LKTATHSNWVPDRCEMIWVNFNPGSGQEMKDEHPMLVLSTRAFNDRTGIVIGLPMTHAASNEDNPFAVKYAGPRGEVGYVLTHQPKSFDWRARGARPHHWHKVSHSVFDAAREGLESIIRLSG